MSRPLHEVLVPGPARALAGLLDLPGDDIDDGWALPPLWHWVYVLERPAQADLGPEGHPRHGIPQPPRPGMRRMFAGGRVQTHRPLLLGEPATRTVEVIGNRVRHGRSGELTIVTTRATIEQRGAVAIVDEQDIVYRAGGPLPARDPGADEPLPAHVDIAVDETMLFRFSALTYNAHRIHYDADYCRDVEGYAGLVVHGPLQALLMAEQARGRGPSAFTYRLIAPLTLGQGMRVGHDGAGRTVYTEVRDHTGRRTASGQRTPLD